MFRQCGDRDLFRINLDVRFAKVDFLGEHSIDAGGPFRELISLISNELMSSDLPLFVPSPNQRAVVGSHRDKWVPVPSAGSRALYLQLYECVGKLMGMSTRARAMF